MKLITYRNYFTKTGLPLMLSLVSPIYSTKILHLDSLQYRLPNRYPPPLSFIPVSEKYNTIRTKPSSCTLWFGTLHIVLFTK